MLRFAMWPASRSKPNLSNIYPKEATNWPGLHLLSLFVHITFDFCEQESDTAASTQSEKCTCSWLFPPCVLVNRTNKTKLREAETKAYWPTVTHQYSGKSVYSTTDCCSRLRQKKYCSSTGGAYLSLPLSGFILVPNIKRVNYRGLSSDLPYRTLGIYTASF